ncbi:helix-turn-helix domain-containing protein [Microbacterium barkeri]|uniref:winged helix-turn-helix domain-containing protein n=1 Tax=Microbacterium barkeri TaxID=33917 RepID=UPI0024AED4C4|nr:helix-turn-helix domain-containing protein [Microbacterium barkeri]MDI6942307.1 helix-turn-helix domain-containing protein [Microbacterium barkeri]
MTDEQAKVSEERETRVLDTAALRALAHPLRVRILDLLSREGPQTASSLAALTGESSGSTSYHLRMLARHDLVREVAGRGGRERWWERPRGRISFGSESVGDSPAGRAVLQVAVAEYHRARFQEMFDYFTGGYDDEPEEWRDASVSTTSTAHLTAAQLKELAERADALFSEYVDRYRGQEGEGVRSVSLRADLFPLPQRGAGS